MPTIAGTPKILDGRSFVTGHPLFNSLACFYWGGSNTDLLTGRQGQLFDDDGGLYSYVDSPINNMVGGKSLVGAQDRNGVHITVPSVRLTNDLPGVYDDFTIIYYGRLIAGGSVFTLRNSLLDQFISLATFVDPNSADGTIANMVFTVRGATGQFEMFSAAAAKGISRMYTIRKRGNQCAISVNGLRVEGFNSQNVTGSMTSDGQLLIGKRDLDYYSNQRSRPDVSLLVVYKRCITDAEDAALAINPFTILPSADGIVLPPPSNGFRKRAKVFYIGNSVSDIINPTKLSKIANDNRAEHIYGRHIKLGAPLSLIQATPTEGFNTFPYGYAREALVDYDWDVLSLQPFDSPPNEDLVSINYFLGLLYSRATNANTRILIYSRWHRQTNEAAPYDIAAFWNRPYDGNYEYENKDFFQQLTILVRAAHPTKTINIVPVGDALLLFDVEAKAGRVPGIATAKDAFNDGIHFNEIGSYLVGCVYYATIYKEDPAPLGFSEYSGVTQALADKIQSIAWTTVDKHPFSGVDSSAIVVPSPDPIPTPTPTPILQICPCINLNQLPRIEAVEGASFDRTFTLLDSNGNPYVFSPTAVCSFLLRTRIDGVISQIAATVLPTPGQIRFQMAATQTTGRVGRFVWSGTIADGGRIVVLESNEFYLKEGVLGEIASDPPSTIPPPNPGGSGGLILAGTFIPTLNQSVFLLTFAPDVPSKSFVFLNGVKYRYATHYLIDGVIFRWLSPISLNTFDTLEVYS